MSSSIQQPDVLVMGGGPGGSTVATLLAREGHSVVLLEKEAHPRFHIGESLLPKNLPILDRLGVLEEVREIGVKKPGADFTPGDTHDHLTFQFGRALGDSPDHAFEVKREDFDALLFTNAARNGVETHEEHAVTGVELAASGRHRVQSRSAQGEHSWEPRFVIDATGRDGLLARKNGWRRKNPRHASAAVFGHFRNVERRSGEDSGNISVYWFEHGWFWMIPLRDDVMSVGAVCWPEYLKSRRSSAEDFLRQTIALNGPAAARMRGAEACGPVRVTGNYSYTSDRLFGRNWIMVGDSYAFIDPVFSSGVYLAMSSAEQAAVAVDTGLKKGDSAFARSARRYKRRLDRGIAEFSWFIYRFTTPAMRTLFANPRNDWQVEQAIISMLAGDVYDAPVVRRKLRIFRAIYALTRLGQMPAQFRAWRRRRQNANLDFTPTDAA